MRCSLWLDKQYFHMQIQAQEEVWRSCDGMPRYNVDTLSVQLYAMSHPAMMLYPTHPIRLLELYLRGSYSTNNYRIAHVRARHKLAISIQRAALAALVMQARALNVPFELVLA